MLAMRNSDDNGQHFWPKARVLPIAKTYCIGYFVKIVVLEILKVLNCKSYTFTVLVINKLFTVT